MRLRLTALTALAAGALLALGAATATATAAGPAHAAPVDALAVDAYGTAAEDGTVTLTGSYRCADDSAGPVFVSSTLVQANRSTGIGGTRAVCDGLVHRWTNSAVVKDPGYRTGSAHVEATLMQLTATGPLGLPMPAFLAQTGQDVTLR
ncbi:DUF6299 family protein [Streptomyces sp. NPDC048623]|uniref:DUF6299 family protein n=1 Tax=Streptomyces sp. NPDC048623 TaxID=3155761 RepID=UPI0034184E9F